MSNPSFGSLESDIFGPTLEPLRAETASGKVINFKRRPKPHVRHVVSSPVLQTHGKNLAERQQQGESSAASGVSHLLGQPLHHLLADVQELKSRERAVR